MNTAILTMTIVGGAFAVLGLGALLGRLPRKGRAKEAVEKVESEAEKLLPAIDKGLTFAVELGKAIDNIVPVNLKGAVEILPTAALAAVKQIEAVKDAGIITPEQRKAVATTMIKTDLTAAHIPIDDNTEKVISVVIDAMCLAKPTAFSAATTSVQ